MSMFPCVAAFQAQQSLVFVDFVSQLELEGLGTWITAAIVGGCIAFFVIYEKVTGKPFVKSKEERREARRRRKIVLWEYKRNRKDGDRD
jgi:hypothetical protein